MCREYPSPESPENSKQGAELVNSTALRARLVRGRYGVDLQLSYSSVSGYN
jgi:hypothetical protein